MAIFMSRPEFSDLTFSNYREAYEWLDRHGLLENSYEHDEEAIVRAFLGALQDEGLSWLQDGAAGIPSPAFLPEPVLAAAEQLGLDPALAWQVALELGRKVDLERRNQVGALGELAIVKFIEGLSLQAEHLSLRSDALGWDIRVLGQGLEAHLEVKTTTSLGRLRVFITRNEYEVSRRDPLWGLVVALVDDSGTLARIAHIPTNELRRLVPEDKGPLGRWQSCSLDLIGPHVRPGLPSPLATLGAPSIITTTIEPAWWPLGAGVKA